MGGRVSLALVIHNHQPVGNFGWVIEHVYEHAYSPMLHALERHPGIHLGLHYTGPLLQWLAANRPEAIAQIRVLVDRGQVEILGGGYYEPILVTLPDRDRHGQLVRMADEMQELFGRRPRGAWLAERIWEPSLAYDLAEAGYDWTVLDDNHLRAASIPEDGTWTALTTDDRGRRLTVFGTDQGLRYLIPFRPVDEVISYMYEHTSEDGRFIGVMGDDSEKFGSWPGTYEYCWSGEHWVDRFFEAVEASGEWLATVTPSEWLENRPPTTRVYVPTASYIEMTEWALPPNETPVFVALLENARARRLPEARFLQGGFWRNYMARYREINEMNKQMLRVSDKVDSMAPGAARDRALDHLYQGQSNDCYWHGLFGGIYIVHMRMATLSHLIAAEDLADAVLAADEAEAYGARLVDTDLDAVDEVLVTTPGQVVVLDLAEGAGISSWDLRASRMALASVMRRRPEAYHENLVAHDSEVERQAKAESEAAEEDAARAASEGPKTIHEIINAKEPGLASYLRYDRHERRSGLVHAFPISEAITAKDLIDASYDELGDFVDAPYELDTLTPGRVTARRTGPVRVDGTELPLEIIKDFRFGGGRPDPTLELAVTVVSFADQECEFELAVEWNLNLLGGGHNPAAFYEVESGERSPHDVAGEVAAAKHIAFGNAYEGVRVDASIKPAARLTWYPVETVSNSEGGFERVYQGSCLLFRWRVSLGPRASRTVCVTLESNQSRDRSAEEDSA